MTTVWTVAAVTGFLLMLTVHEMAHALALRSYGLRVAEVGLGVPVAPRLVLAPSARRPFSFSLSPWVIMAYTRVHEDDLGRSRSLDYRRRSWFLGSGVVVNAVVGAVLLAVVFAVEGKWGESGLWVAGAVLAWLFRTWLCAYVLPVLSVLFLVLVVLTLFSALGQPFGPVGMGLLLLSHGPLDALKTVALSSLAVAVANVLPLYPFDGFRMLGDLVRRSLGSKAEAVYESVGASLVVTLLLVAVVSDVLWILA